MQLAINNVLKTTEKYFFLEEVRVVIFRFRITKIGYQYKHKFFWL